MGDLDGISQLVSVIGTPGVALMLGFQFWLMRRNGHGGGLAPGSAKTCREHGERLARSEAQFEEVNRRLDDLKGDVRAIPGRIKNGD